MKKRTVARVLLASPFIAAIVTIACLLLLGKPERGGPSRSIDQRSETNPVIGTENKTAAADKLDWDHPVVDGIRVNPGAVGGIVPFKPILPAALGSPATVFVHGRAVPREQQLLAAVYDTAAYGRFVLLEAPTALTQDGLERIPAGCRADTGCEGAWTLTKLADATTALVIAAPRISNGIIWLRGRVMFDVYGPADTFTIAEAAAVADVVASTSN